MACIEYITRPGGYEGRKDSTMIKMYKKGSQEYKALESAAALLTAVANRTTYKVEGVYFDIGQGWMWTTVVAYRDDGVSWQALTPREHNLITDGGTLNDIHDAVAMVLASAYNPDNK
jgi:hypothetical protein